jgi:imidazolonepropionase-like amidohydrolase
LDNIGIDNIAFETDYPHGDSTWPNSKLIATEMMSHLSTKEIWKIVLGNAARLLGLPIEDMNA